MDLLASKVITLDRFDSRHRYTLVEAVDAFVALWDQYSLLYASPSTSALQYCDERHSGAPYSARLAHVDVDLMSLLVDALWALSAHPNLFSILPIFFMVAVFCGMVV